MLGAPVALFMLGAPIALFVLGAPVAPFVLGAPVANVICSGGGFSCKMAMTKKWSSFVSELKGKRRRAWRK